MQRCPFDAAILMLRISLKLLTPKQTQQYFHQILHGWLTLLKKIQD